MIAATARQAPVRFVRDRAPGLLLCLTIALAATQAGPYLNLSPLLLALLIGAVLGGSITGAVHTKGIAFCARGLIQVGIGLLGFRVTAADVAAIDPMVLWVVPLLIIGTVAVAIAMARWAKLPRAVGLLTGAATAICGASAALAVAAILPRSVSNDRFTSLTVLGAVSLSTLAMIAYPLLGRWLHLAPDQIAILLGAAIHDVAQVAAAGGGVSPEVQELAVMVKLYRVSMLAPIVMALSMALGRGGWRRLTPPIYLLAFVACAILGNTGWIPDGVKSAALAVSSWCILLSVAAAGAKIVLADVLAQSRSVLGLMCIEALALLGAVLCLIAFAG